MTTADAAELFEAQQKLAEVEEELATLAYDIETKDQEIENLNFEISEKEQEIDTLNQNITEKDQEITTLNDTIQVKEKEFNIAKLKAEQEIQELHNTYKEEKKELKEANKKVVDDLNKDFAAKEKGLKEEKRTIQKELTDLTKTHRAQTTAFEASKKNLSNLTNSYQSPAQRVALKKSGSNQQASNLELQEKEKQITDLKEEHERELVRYQQELASTQQVMEELKQLVLNPKPIGGTVAHNGIKKSDSSNDLTKSSDLLDQKLAVTNILAKQQNNKTSVVTPKASPTNVVTPVRTAGSGSQVISKSIVVGANTPKVVKAEDDTTKTKSTIPTRKPAVPVRTTTLIKKSS